MREEYQKILNQIPKEDLIYLDGSGFDLTIKKEYGWKLKGQRKYLKRITVISAYSNQTKKLIAPFYFGGNTNSEMFNLWVKEVLLPELKSNQTIIIDNAAFHKNKIIPNPIFRYLIFKIFLRRNYHKMRALCPYSLRLYDNLYQKDDEY